MIIQYMKISTRTGMMQAVTIRTAVASIKPFRMPSKRWVTVLTPPSMVEMKRSQRFWLPAFSWISWALLSALSMVSWIEFS